MVFNFSSAEYYDTLGVVTLDGVVGMIAPLGQKPALDIANFEALQSCSRRLSVNLQHYVFGILYIFIIAK